MTNKTKTYDLVTTNKLKGSTVEITGSIPSHIWESNKKLAIKNLNETITIDGFRKGMIPENIMVAKIGDAAINEEMAEIALSKAYIDILIENKIEAIGKPKVKITKIANGNPLEFVITTAVIPEIKLPDYKKIASDMMGQAGNNKVEVTEKEVDETILEIRKSRVSHKDHDHAKMTPEEHEKAIADKLPEFNDEFVRSLGDYRDVNDFKVKIREMIGKNKEDELKEKTRIAIADAIADETKIDMPEILIESELDRTQTQFASDIERMGVKMEDYIKHAKKTIEDIRKEWRPHAEKKAKLQLILNSIATNEKIRPDQQEIDAEVDHIVDHYKDADRERASIYAETVLTNEKVFQFLEGAKQP